MAPCWMYRYNSYCLCRTWGKENRTSLIPKYRGIVAHHGPGTWNGKRWKLIWVIGAELRRDSWRWMKFWEAEWDEIYFWKQAGQKNETRNWFWILGKDLQCKSVWSGEKEVTEGGHRWALQINGRKETNGTDRQVGQRSLHRPGACFRTRKKVCLRK